VLTTLVLAGLLDIRVDFHLGFFILLSLAVSLAYSALAVLIATMAGSSRLRSMLTPILLLPLLFPLLFAALELTHQIVAKSPIVDPTWLYFLGGLDVLYLLIGSLLFEHVIRE
jgi:heme exporter protein B